MKTNILIAAIITAASLALQPVTLFANDSGAQEEATYQESIQDNEDSMDSYDDMPADSEDSHSGIDAESVDDYNDSESSSEY